MVQNRRHNDGQLGTTSCVWDCFGCEQLHLFRACAGWQSDLHLLLTDRDEFADGSLHHHWVGEVDQVHGDGVLLPPEGNVKHAWTGYGHGRWLIRGPVNG